MDSSTNRKIGIVLSYAYTIASICVQLIYVPLLLGGIGQDEYGLYQLVGSFASWVMSMNGILSAAVVRYYCKYKAENNVEKMNSTLALSRRIYLVLSVVAIGVMAIFAIVFPFIYKDTFTPAQIHECSLMLIVLGFNIATTMSNTVDLAAITANERFIFLKGIQLAVTFLEPLMVLLMLETFPNALMVTCVVFSMNLLSSVCRTIFSRKVLKIKIKYQFFDRGLFKSLVAFSGVVLLVTCADQIFWKTDQLIIGYYYGPSEVAIYAIGAQVYSAYMMLGLAISSVFMPRISELYGKPDGLKEVNSLFIQVGRLSLYVLLGVLCGFFIFGRDFVSLWAGGEYIEAWYIAVIIMVPFTIDLVQNLGLTILQVTNNYLFRGVMYFALALVNIVLTIVLLNRIGIVGAAISTALAMFVGNGVIMNLYYFKKIKLDIPAFWGSLAKEAIPLILLTAVVYFIWNGINHDVANWGTLIAGIGIYCILYLIVVRIFSMNDYEKHLLNNVLKRN